LIGQGFRPGLVGQGALAFQGEAEQALGFGRFRILRFPLPEITYQGVADAQEERFQPGVEHHPLAYRPGGVADAELAGSDAGRRIGGWAIGGDQLKFTDSCFEWKSVKGFPASLKYLLPYYASRSIYINDDIFMGG